MSFLGAAITLLYSSEVHVESCMSNSFICSDVICTFDVDSEIRLVDVKEISKAGVALELAEFQAVVSRHIEAAREHLKTQWFPAIENIFLLVIDLILFR
jgi:hypothetical protein